MIWVWLSILMVCLICVSRAPTLGGMLVMSTLPAYLLRTHLGLLPTTMLEAVILGTILGGFLSLQKNNALRDVTHTLLEKKYFLFFTALFFLASCISVFLAPALMPALGLWRAYFLEPLLLLPFLFLTLQNEAIKKILFRILAVEIVLLASIAVLQHFALLPIPTPWQTLLRATSIYPYPNAFGLFAAPLGIFFLALALDTPSSQNDRVLFGLAFACALAGSIATQTLSAVFLLILLALPLYWRHSAQGKAAVILAVIFSCGALLSEPLRTLLFDKLFLHTWSGVVRQSMWHETWQMLRDHALLGVGIGGYPTALVPYHTTKGIEIFQYPHNEFLTAWSELGLLGLIAWIGLLGTTLKESVVQFSSSPLARAGGIALLLILIQGLVDVPYFKNDLAIELWFFVVIIFVPVSLHKTARA